MLEDRRAGGADHEDRVLAAPPVSCVAGEPPRSCLLNARRLVASAPGSVAGCCCSRPEPATIRAADTVAAGDEHEGIRESVANTAVRYAAAGPRLTALAFLPHQRSNGVALSFWNGHGVSCKARVNDKNAAVATNEKNWRDA
jgi:hypothetical protein